MNESQHIRALVRRKKVYFFDDDRPRAPMKIATYRLKSYHETHPLKKDQTFLNISRYRLNFVFLVYSLRKHPFLHALRRWGRFARRNVCDLATEIPY